MYFINQTLHEYLHCIIGTTILINFCIYMIYFLKNLKNKLSELSSENNKIKAQISHVNNRINGIKFKHNRVVKKNKPVTKVHNHHNSIYEELQNTFIAQDGILTQ
ncbi:Hypothetical protein PACV_331 [Pacmanvirus A23]|uniref:Hypothetical protein n=1 Tax=Pacmanvirus A23 TaxID=1932881 RepID=UPI000A093D5F|nr:Hypothetical protein B9W72_gp327 [Pacmanvirus A23]SIP86044.1 Hypothetical protein PACV_331 [Pacmanvirus A23]